MKNVLKILKNSPENIHSVNSSYPMIGKVIEHIERCSIEWNSIEENNENKYLVLRSTDENK